MNKNINYGTINKKGGAKNRLFKFVLCFCLGVVSLLGIGAKMTANAQVLDIYSDKVVTSDNSKLNNNILNKDYLGYFEYVGTSGSGTSLKIEIRLFDFDNNVYSSITSSDYFFLSSGVGGSMLNYSTYDDIVGCSLGYAFIPNHISQLDLRYIEVKVGGIMSTEKKYFISRYLYNLYLTSQNSGGASSSELEAEYNKGYQNGYNAGLEDNQDNIYNSGYNSGYSSCQSDMVDTLRQEYQNGYNVGKGEGINEGISQGYQNGYNAGLNDNQDLIYNTGYNDGYSTGEDDGYDKGYDIGFSDSQNDKNSFKELMFSIIDAPFNVLGNAFDFEIFGINMSDFLIAIVSLLLVSVVIRKLM